ncbi:acyl-CoA thioesterase [Mongoliitalea daihaiensis]|uniref:acyl-CoA thioesterase n=1 Tax=Mongoliitalea daihaiensis TaxID=2782006 RepID=UPI001F459695|nr:thioesterase family protein [Mongoliitalea daihaiensis]UJP66677.1 acyl-CoA thioesterase [Mongoliitalea daihaiensis]
MNQPLVVNGLEDVRSSFSFSVPLQIRFSDIDGYMHVNNGVYFSYLEHARALFLYQQCGWDVMDVGTVVADLHISYKKPIHAFDKVSAFVRCKHVGNSSFVLEQVLAGMTEHGAEVVYASASVVMVSVDMKTMKPTPVPEQYRVKLEQK